MVLVCHVISLDHVIKESCELEGGSQVTTLPEALCYGDMFVVVEEQDSTCSCLNPVLLFISLFISRTWSSNRRKIQKQLLPVRPKQRQEEKNKKGKWKAIFVRWKCNKGMIYLALLSLLYWFLKNKKNSLRLTVLTYITSVNICDCNIFW